MAMFLDLLPAVRKGSD